MGFFDNKDRYFNENNTGRSYEDNKDDDKDDDDDD